MTKTSSSHRLFIDHPFVEGANILCSATQAHYLMSVLRLGDGSLLPVFNGGDGEWLAQLVVHGKKKCGLLLLERRRAQTGGPSLHYLFAPLKKGRLDYMVQKATELGVMSVQPVFTRRTNVARLKEARLEANIIEAAEQCGVLRIPQLKPACKLGVLLQGWDTNVPLIFCDESAAISNPLKALAQLQGAHSVALLVGPEGGFDEEERCLLLSHPFVYAISLGPRIMRADTAAVAALTLVNAVLFEGM